MQNVNTGAQFEDFDYSILEYPEEKERVAVFNKDGNIEKRLFLGNEALFKFIGLCKTDDTILDIGCGLYQIHSKIMREYGLHPKTADFFDNCDYKGFYSDIKFDDEFDAIWLCHVLEHVLDIDAFLKKIINDIKEGGILAITVPPAKQTLVGGHINLFNPGILLYRLILAGFDCSDARVKSYGYNISVILKVKKIREMPKLKYDNGDIETLANYFPFEAKQNCGAEIETLNWGKTYIYIHEHAGLDMIKQIRKHLPENVTLLPYKPSIFLAKDGFEIDRIAEENQENWKRILRGLKKFYFVDGILYADGCKPLNEIIKSANYYNIHTILIVDKSKAQNTEMNDNALNMTKLNYSMQEWAEI